MPRSNKNKYALPGAYSKTPTNFFTTPKKKMIGYIFLLFMFAVLIITNIPKRQTTESKYVIEDDANIEKPIMDQTI